jgi:hypothetical protein
MYSVNRTRKIAGVLVAVASGLAAAALSNRAPAQCECDFVHGAPIHVLPEMEVVATRLPPAQEATPTFSVR